MSVSVNGTAFAIDNPDSKYCWLDATNVPFLYKRIWIVRPPPVVLAMDNVPLNVIRPLTPPDGIDGTIGDHAVYSP